MTEYMYSMRSTEPIVRTPRKFSGAPPKGFVPRNRLERRALESWERTAAKGKAGMADTDCADE